MRGLGLFAHLSAVAVWVGGMFFAHFCLRPALGALDAPARLALMAQVLRRFLGWVGVAIVLLWVSGLARLATVGLASAPIGWHAMLALGAAMTLVYLVIVARYVPRMRRALAEGDVPRAGASLAVVRGLVLLNLVLGVLTIAAATLGTGLG